VKDVFCKKFFGAGRDSAGGALAVLRKHSTERRTPDAVDLLANRPTYELLCIHKSSKQTGNLPGGMWQAGNTASNVDRADRKPSCGAELTKRQDVKRPGIRGRGE
jgi:hypothetical protein